jgi:hypothetical protein
MSAVNENWFSDLADKRERITQRRPDYNKSVRTPACSTVPMEFAAQAAASTEMMCGQEASNVGLPHAHAPSPLRRKACGANKDPKKSHYPWTKEGADHIMVLKNWTGSLDKAERTHLPIGNGTLGQGFSSVIHRILPSNNMDAKIITGKIVPMISSMSE